MSTAVAAAPHHPPSLKKPRAVVKPMLRKLTHNEKQSLDLDRPSWEQETDGDMSGVGNGSWSLHDVSYTSNSSGPKQSTRRGYHNRSTSGASQFSTATTASGQRSATFVHPFQQTPRPYTPPLRSYQGSLIGSEASHPRESPTVPEEDSDPLETAASSGGLHHAVSMPANALNLQMPQTSRSGAFTLRTSNVDIASPTESTSSRSAAVRSSFDGFRLRSRSDALPRSHADDVREARRKFQQKEQAKDEKRAREEMRARTKKEEKEARQVARDQRRAASMDAARIRRRSESAGEKGVPGPAYGSIPAQDPRFAADSAQPPARSHTANTKRKTQSTWTAFMMWLRTRFLRMSNKYNSSTARK